MLKSEKERNAKWRKRESKRERHGGQSQSGGGVVSAESSTSGRERVKKYE
jgi:hypothetical protein